MSMQQQQHSCYSGMLLEQVNPSSTTTRGAWNLGEKTKLNSCTNVAVLNFPPHNWSLLSY
jgi:hypothetical protein